MVADGREDISGEREGDRNYKKETARSGNERAVWERKMGISLTHYFRGSMVRLLVTENTPGT